MRALISSCISILLIPLSVNAQNGAIESDSANSSIANDSLIQRDRNYASELLSPWYCLYGFSWEKNRSAEIDFNQFQLEKNSSERNKYRKSNLNESMAGLKSVLEMYPDDIVSLYNLAVLQFEASQLSKAKANLRKANLAIDDLTLEKLKQTNVSKSEFREEPEKVLEEYKTKVKEKVQRFQKYLSDFSSKSENSKRKQN